MKEIYKKDSTENYEILTKTIDSPYYDFSPIDVCEDEDKSAYEEEFNQIKYALENDKVKNLAILGKFGTGKSSLISSFFKHAQINNKKISDKEYVTVSLADFDYLKENSSDNFEDDLAGNSKSDKDNTSDTTSQNNSNASSENRVDLSNKNNQSSGKSAYQNLEAVEKEIIRQLSFGKLSENVPISFLSKFKTRLCDTFVISLYLSPLLVLVLSSFFIKDEIVHLFNYTPVSTLTKLFVLTAITVAYVFIFFKFLSPRLRFKHLSLSSLSISVEQRDSDNIIDAYLDEITFLFEQSKCKYVIFEDLDRGNNPEVFTHLRNLNIVLNNDIRCKNKNRCFWKRCQRRIVFIYLLRNDLLSPHDMVKFFDFTISITPYAASSNIAYHALKIRDELFAYYKKIEDDKSLEDKLKASQDFGDNVPSNQQYKITQMSSESKIFKRSKLFTEEALDNDFIISVSRFVGDLRNVKQIFNDYQLLIGNFEFLFDESKNIAKKIFSISVLKKDYPSDYNELLSNTGKLYELMNRQEEYLSFVEANKKFFEKKNTISCEDSDSKIQQEEVKKNDKTRSIVVESNFSDYTKNLDKAESFYSFYDLVNRKDCNPDFSTYVKQRPLLRYLLCNNYLSEDYRFYVTKFSNNFALTKSEYSFLRNVYDTDSKYQPDFDLHQNNLELVFYLLPNCTIYSKAILNYSFFSFILNKSINLEIDSYGKFLYRYVKNILNKNFSSEGPNFILLICSNLNNNLFDIKNRQKVDFEKLKRLFSAILFNCGNLNNLTKLFDDKYFEYEFLLYLSVYGTQIFTYDGKLAKWEGIDGFKDFISSKNLGNYFLDNIALIPKAYWINLFNSMSFLGIEFSELPDINVLGLDKIEIFLNLLNVVQPKSKVLFDVNGKNLSTLSQYLLSIENEKNGIFAEVSLELCSNSFLSLLFPLNKDKLTKYHNLKRSIFSYLFGNDLYIRFLSVTEIYTRFLNIEDNNRNSNFNISLTDSPEVILSILLSNHGCVIETCCATTPYYGEKGDTYTFEKDPSFNKELVNLLNKYRVEGIEISDIDKVSLCFLDFEDFFIDELHHVFENLYKLHSIFEINSFYCIVPQASSYSLAKVKLLFNLLTYSFINKVNPNSPRNRISPNIGNIVYIRDCIQEIDPRSYEFSVDKILRETWFALYKFYQKFYQEIYDSNLFLREYNVVQAPEFNETEDIQGTFEDNVKRIKDFFLNLDKQD
ncbi:MAG: hypothetical protein MR556_10915 [Succinatimonas sp.]|nr:hypothetical protein [Succinatimonas sp.]